MKKTATIILAAIMMVFPFTAAAEVVSEVAVLVNDEPITTYDIAKEQAALEKNLGTNVPSDEAGKQQLRQAVLNSLISKKLVDQKIRELDIRVSDEEVRQAIEDVKKANNISEDNLRAALAAQGISFDLYKSQVKEQLERLRLISIEVRSKIQVSEKEIKEFYEANPEKFQVDESFRVRQIFFPVSKEADVKKATAQAENVLKEAKGGADFAELARKNSADFSAKEGGDLGYLKKGEILPEFESALVKMKPGEISGLIRTPAGIHIVKLEEYRPGKRQNFEAAKQEVEDLLYKSKSEERFNQWLEDLKKNASIVIKENK